LTKKENIKFLRAIKKLRFAQQKISAMDTPTKKRASSAADPNSKRLAAEVAQAATAVANPSPAARRYFHGTKSRICAYNPSCFVEKELYFLSNFYPSPFVVNGLSYATAEHFYQSAKFPGRHSERVRLAATPALAKRLGSLRSEPFHSNWDGSRSGTPPGSQMRDKAMRRALKAKFTQNPNLRALLEATGSAVLHEDAPKDPYWGVRGHDRLGRELCALRSEFLRSKATATAAAAAAEPVEPTDDDDGDDNDDDAPTSDDE
jgi:ribA/ribD-fused uncharacterized protein